MTQLFKLKQNIHKHKDKSFNPQKKHKKRLIAHSVNRNSSYSPVELSPSGLYEVYLLTVPIEDVARCQHKTVLIIFPLNLQTIIITLDVVKWRGGKSQW